LASAERKVFVALLDLWDPKGARDIATAARMGVSQTSASLSRLVSRGAVMVLPAKGRKKLYQATERLYNIYYLMRRRSHPSSRVRAVVAFMVNFYPSKELVDATARLAGEACLLNPIDRADHFHAYLGIWEAIKLPKLRKNLLKLTPKSFFSAPDAPESIHQLQSILLLQSQQKETLEEFKKVKALIELGQDEEALTILDSLNNRLEDSTEFHLNELLAFTFFFKGMILDSMGCSEEAIAVYDEVIHRFENRTELPLLEQLAKALVNKGMILDSMGRSEEAIAVYNEVIHRLENRTELPLLEQLAKALINKGITLGSMGRFEEAEQSVEKSLEIGPINWSANGLLACLLIFQQKWTDLWNMMPTALNILGTEEEAIEPTINLLLYIAATGHAAKVLKIVSKSNVASILEPLMVGLQIFLGEQPLVAQEILEIGQDVAQRIRDLELKQAQPS
jgi:tetratricopeptide (TPR) repeat protein